ncbi:MAG: hypothetical protein COA86_08370 [Kangiella sp.]|nr:MAG: hypothetical protein COA86_08370 [Kangiella sp.]
MLIKSESKPLNLSVVSIGLTLICWNLSIMVSKVFVSLWMLILCFLFVWLIVNFWLGPVLSKKPISLKLRLIIWFGILVIIFGSIHNHGNRIIKEEGFEIIKFRAQDRQRLENLPSIAPATIVSGRRQTFYIYSPESNQVSWQFEGGEILPTQHLGMGLHRIDYDPRLDGAANRKVLLHLPDQIVERELHFVFAKAHPRWLVSDPDKGIAFGVSKETDQLIIIDRNGDIRVVSVGDGPSDVVILDDTTVAISYLYESDIWLYDYKNDKLLKEISVGGFQKHIAKHPNRPEVAVAIEGIEPKIAVINTVSHEVTQRINLDESPEWIVYGPKGDSLVFSSRTPRALYRLDRIEEEFQLYQKPLFFGRPVLTISRKPGSPYFYVATTGYNPSGDAPLGNHFVQDQLLKVSIEKWEVLEQMITTRKTQQQKDPIEVGSGGSPMGISMSGSNELLVTFAGTDEVWAIQGAKPPRQLLDRKTIGGLWAPHGIADLGNGYFAVTSPSQGAIGVFDKNRNQISIKYLALDDKSLEKADYLALQIRRGERNFFETTRAGLSCQSCHTDGGESDRSAHDITSTRYKGEIIPYTTLSLKGIARTAPYLRDASFSSVADLMRVANSRYKGYVRKVNNRGQDIQHWVESLPPQLNPYVIKGRNLERERAGLKAYVLAQCDSCHSFPAFTNLGQHIPSRLFPEYAKRRNGEEIFDTPSLIALSSSPPFLQDGRAETIHSIFDEHNADNRHGDTKILSKKQLLDLEFFLESL